MTDIQPLPFPVYPGRIQLEDEVIDPDDPHNAKNRQDIDTESEDGLREEDAGGKQHHDEPS
jgi:hypothetical protein